MYNIFKTVAVLSVVFVYWQAFQAALWLFNQPSDFAIFGGVLLLTLPPLVGIGAIVKLFEKGR